MEKVKLYGTGWCPDSLMAQRFFDQNDIEYEFIDIDRDDGGRRIVEETNNGNRSVPTIFFEDGTVLVEPSRSQLARQVGVEVKSSWKFWER